MQAVRQIVHSGNRRQYQMACVTKELGTNLTQLRNYMLKIINKFEQWTNKWILGSGLVYGQRSKNLCNKFLIVIFFRAAVINTVFYLEKCK